MVKQTSLEAYALLRRRKFQGKHHQMIIALMSDGKLRSREQIQNQTGLKIQTITARCRELTQEDILYCYGFGKTSSGCTAELLKLR